MVDKSDSITETNQKAKRAFNGKDEVKTETTSNTETVTEANEAANAEFNADGDDLNLGNRVGGIRGSSD